MDIPMVNVTARIMDQRGRPVQRARITMRLTTVERFCGFVVPREVTAHTDNDGIAVLRVWPRPRVWPESGRKRRYMSLPPGTARFSLRQRPGL